jgi:MFS transporter, PHS family, inorganic phosphate transporter
MLTGIFSTFLIPETAGRSLEELSNENQVGFVKGVAKKIKTREDGLVVEA